jgi:hypothetical protein
MIVQYTDIFHCQTCGRMVYQPQGALPPTCCSEPMVRAVADVVHEPTKCAVITEQTGSPASRRLPAEVTEHAVVQEVADLSNWCHSVDEEDGSRYGELARRLRSLHDLLLDRYDAEERTGANVLAADARFGHDVARLRREDRDLLESLDHLIHDLGHGEAGFRGWVEVCERFDSFAADCQRHEQAEIDLVQTALEEDLGTVD